MRFMWNYYRKHVQSWSQCTLLLVWIAHTTSAITVEFQAEYFSNTTIQCNHRLLNLPYTAFKKYWITPNGTTIQWSHAPQNRSKFLVGETPDFNLTINYIDDADYGWYICVILWDNYIYLVHSMKIGLNVNGALYPQLSGHYLSNAIIGLIAGGSAAALIALLCLLYWCRYSEVNTENEDKTEKTTESRGKKVKKNFTFSENTTLKETEAIYELDKAVKCFDDNDIIIGEGEIALAFRNEAYIEEDAATDGMPRQIFEPRSEAAGLQGVEAFTEEDGGGYAIVPTPPPPPPFLISKVHNSKDGGHRDVGDHSSIMNREKSEEDQAAQFLFQEELIEHVKERCNDDVAF